METSVMRRNLPIFIINAPEQCFFVRLYLQVYKNEVSVMWLNEQNDSFTSERGKLAGKMQSTAAANGNK